MNKKLRRPLSKSMIRQIKEGIKEASDPNKVVRYDSWDEFISEMENLCN